MEDGQQIEVLERFKANVSDLAEARLCLEAASKDINIKELKLFLQILNEKFFVLINDSTLWIATSAGKNIDASTILSTNKNLSLKSLVKDHVKLVKAGVELAKGSTTYQFKAIPSAQIDSMIPSVESTFKSNKHNLVFLSSSSSKVGEIPLKSTDMVLVDGVIKTISNALGRPQSEFGTFMGHLKSEGLFSNLVRSGLDAAGQTRTSAKTLDIWENFLVAGLNNGKTEQFQITSSVKAELYVDGQLNVSHVSNRFQSAATGSIGMNLIGSAIGGPTHNKKTSDSRTANLQITGPDWQVEMNLLPSMANTARSLVSRINQRTQRESVGQTPNAPATSGGDVATALTKLADLKAQGLLSDEEFEKAKSRLLA